MRMTRQRWGQLSKKMTKRYRPKAAVRNMSHFGPIHHFRLDFKGPTWSVGRSVVGYDLKTDRISFISDRIVRSEMSAFLVVLNEEMEKVSVSLSTYLRALTHAALQNRFVKM